METVQSNTYKVEDQERTTAVFLHLAALLKYVFPFAGIIAQLLIWTSNREKEFVDKNGKRALNFQLSLLLYKVILFIISVPLVIMLLTEFSFFSSVDEIENVFLLISTSFTAYILGIIFFILLILPIAELIILIIAAINANKNKVYKYPLSITFIK